MREEFVDPKRLNDDLSNFYLSRFLTNEIREFYTARERQAFYTGKNQDSKPKVQCKKNWPICYLVLERAKAHPEKIHSLFKSQFILSNFKYDHFSTNKKGTVAAYQSPAKDYQGSSRLAIPDDDLLIERQRHICECKDEEYERMKNEVRTRMSKQMLNYNAVMKQSKDPKNTKSFGKEAKEVYDAFVKKTTVQESMGKSSEHSNSSPNKFSLEHISQIPDSMYQSEFNIDNVEAHILASEQ